MKILMTEAALFHDEVIVVAGEEPIAVADAIDRERRDGVGPTVRCHGGDRDATGARRPGVDDKAPIGRPQRIRRYGRHEVHGRTAIDRNLVYPNANTVLRGDDDPLAIRRPRPRAAHVQRLGEPATAGAVSIRT